MARFSIEGSVVDTDNATAKWEDATDWNGRNRIHRSTRDQWTWQTLYRSRKGRYYVVHSSAWQGSLPHAEWVSPQEAARWLLLNEEDLPEDLEEHGEQVSE